MKQIINKIISIAEFIESQPALAFVEMLIAFMLLVAVCICFAGGAVEAGVICLINLIVVGLPTMARCAKKMFDLE